MLTTRYGEGQLDTYVYQTIAASNNGIGGQTTWLPTWLSTQLDTSALGSARYYDLSDNNTPLCSLPFLHTLYDFLSVYFQQLCGLRCTFSFSIAIFCSTFHKQKPIRTLAVSR